MTWKLNTKRQEPHIAFILSNFMPIYLHLDWPTFILYGTPPWFKHPWAPQNVSSLPYWADGKGIMTLVPSAPPKEKKKCYMVLLEHNKSHLRIFPNFSHNNCVLLLRKKDSEQYLLSVQSLSRVQLFAAPGTTAHQASLSITNYRSLFQLISTESVVPFNHLILCHPLLLLSSIFPSIRVFSNEPTLHIRWPKY